MMSQDSGLPDETVFGGTPDDEPTDLEVTRKALEELLDWAHRANSRLPYEMAEDYQFGGNPYLNPVFKNAHKALEG